MNLRSISSLPSPRTGLAVCVVCLALVTAGCISGSPAGTTTPTGTPATETTDGTPISTDAPTTPTGTRTHSPVTEYETLVFDEGGFGQPLIEGGIAHSHDDEYGDRYYVTAVASTADASRFNHSLLPEAASGFVEETSFENESLVVIQAFPKSSVPDYRVESVSRDGGTLRVAINDSSDMGTDDVTLETVLVRVPGTPPERVTVTTQEGHTFDSTMGVVTPS